MKKEMVVLVLIHSLVQVFAFLLTDLIQSLHFLIFKIDNNLWDFSIFLIYPLQILGFKFFLYRLNKKYNGSLSYFKLLSFGITISFLASLIYYGGGVIISSISRRYLVGDAGFEFILFALSAFFIMIVEFAIIAIFYKKLK